MEQVGSRNEARTCISVQLEAARPGGHGRTQITPAVVTLLRVERRDSLASGRGPLHRVLQALFSHGARVGGAP